jgi:hypothetical protein
MTGVVVRGSEWAHDELGDTEDHVGRLPPLPLHSIDLPPPPVPEAAEPLHRQTERFHRWRSIWSGARTLHQISTAAGLGISSVTRARPRAKMHSCRFAELSSARFARASGHLEATLSARAHARECFGAQKAIGRCAVCSAL